MSPKNKYLPPKIPVSNTDSIEALPLSTRAKNILKSLKISSVNDVLKLTQKQLHGLPNCGRKTKLEIDWVSERIELVKREANQQHSVTGQFHGIGGKINFEKLPLDQKIILVRQISELELPVRAINLLAENDLKYVGDLVQAKKSDLMTGRNFGKISLKLVIRELNQMSLSLGVTLEGWNWQVAETWGTKLDARLGELSRREINRFLDGCKSDRFLENDLFEIACKYSDNRRGKILQCRFGWDGSQPRSLSSVGEEYGITRQRVQQIVERFENEIPFRKKLHDIDSVRSAVAVVKSRMPYPAVKLENEFATLGISKNPFRLEGLTTIFKVDGEKIPFEIKSINGVRFALPI